jgi:hypothetical protein
MPSGSGWSLDRHAHVGWLFKREFLCPLRRAGQWLAVRMMSREPPFTEICQTMSGFNGFAFATAPSDYPEVNAFLQCSIAVDSRRSGISRVRL